MWFIFVALIIVTVFLIGVGVGISHAYKNAAETRKFECGDEFYIVKHLDNDRLDEIAQK